MKCVLKAKKSNLRKGAIVPFLISLIFLGYFGLVFFTLRVSLPSQESPLQFYSNHLRHDLKLVLIQALKRAKTSITLQIYGLTDPDILHLLEQKKKQGVEVTIFHDPHGTKSLPPSLAAYPVKAGGLMHRKIVVIDQTFFLLGTANFTTHSLKMHDNLVLGIWNPSFAHFLQDSIQDYGHFTMDGLEIACFLLPYFGAEALQEISQLIDQAEKEICIAMFTFTHPHLVEKLIAAHARGVKVIVAIDRYTALGASKKALHRLKQQGICLLTSGGSQLLHHKWALIDKEILVMGSANWTASAFTKNQDCLLIIKGLNPLHQKSLDQIWSSIAILSQMP